jgi:protein-tyrosine phosphatase
VLFRSDRLNALSDSDVAHLADVVGLRTVCDFRYDREVDEDPSRLPVGATVVRLAVGSAPGDNPRSLEDLIRAGELTHVTAEAMAQGYLNMLEQQARLFGDLIRLVADAANHPVVIHCTAGKDRTGLGAALLLGAVGVDRETVIADYALTDEYRSKHRLEEIRPQLEEQGLELDQLKVLFTAPAEVMALTLDEVDERWGGIVGYLQGQAAVTDQELDDLREALVEEP